jgi:Tat protein translocase TatC
VSDDDGKMTFLEHLEELRKRLIISVVAVFVAMIGCWFFREEIMAFLLRPLYEAWRHVDSLDEPKPLNFTSMLEPFVAYLKLSAIGGLFLASPVVLYQLWAFISPGLYPKERRMALPFVLVSTLLFVGGSIMAYAVVFPIGFKFFLDFAAGQEMVSLESTVTVTETRLDTEGTSGRAMSPVAYLDAGPDAAAPVQAMSGSDTAPGPDLPVRKISPKQESVPKRDAQPTHWFSAFIANFIKGDCATFSAIPDDKPGRVRLTAVWQRLKCGDPPKELVVRRNGDRVHLRWHLSDNSEPDKDILYTFDTPPKGAYEYALHFPKNPTEHRLAPVLMVKDYLSFAVRLLLAFGLIFELPILISFLAIAGIVDYKQLIHFFRYFFVLSVIIGAILTPPDVVTQLLLAFPLVILYAFSILVAYFFGERPD